MLTLAIDSVRVREYPLTCKKSWDNGTASHDFYHALLPELAEYTAYYKLPVGCTCT